MNDAISRSAAVKALTHIAMQVGKDKMRTVSRCVNEIEMLPSLDVAPVVHALWKMTDSAYCSRCNRIAVTKYRYCPNCGARMDGEADAFDND
jgi:hypothetical protein